jgi:hypothetical protein
MTKSVKVEKEVFEAALRKLINSKPLPLTKAKKKPAKPAR